MTDHLVGLVGCGRLAEAGYLPALLAASGVRLAAVADPDRRRRDHLAHLAGPDVATFPTAADLLAGTEVDALVLATPVDHHVADARMAAAAGVPTLVDKPPAPDADGAAVLTTLDPAPVLGFNRRFDRLGTARPDARRATGRIDATLQLHYRRASWQAHTVADDALLDLGPHLVDLARWATGREVLAVVGARLSHEEATFSLELEDGRADLHGATDRPHREHLEVRTVDDGQVVARADRGGLVEGVRGRLWPTGDHPLVDSLRAQVEAWARHLSGRPVPELATPHDGAVVMAVVDAVRASAATSGVRVPVTVPADAG